MLDFLGLAPHGAETSKIPAQELPNVLLEHINVVANGTPVKEIIWDDYLGALLSRGWPILSPLFFCAPTTTDGAPSFRVLCERVGTSNLKIPGARG
jgi:hypothetical protein